MAQKRFKIGKTKDTLIEIHQPERNIKWSEETTYTNDSGRVKTGKAVLTPLFTVERLDYNGTDLTITEVKDILQIIGRGKKYWCQYFSPYYGAWRIDEFYTSSNDISIDSLEENEENLSEVSFGMVGVNPLK